MVWPPPPDGPRAPGTGLMLITGLALPRPALGSRSVIPPGSGVSTSRSTGVSSLIVNSASAAA